MSSDLSQSSYSLHSDASPSPRETVASLPLDPATLVISPENQFRSLPSHRRSNTEYIARPPIFENDVYDLNPSNHRPRNRAGPAWTDTFPKKKLEARARILSDWFQGKSESGDLGTDMRSNTRPNSGGMDVSRIGAPSASHMRKNSTPVTGRFSFFGLRRSAEQGCIPPEPADDEFLNLDISAALSSPTPGLNNDEVLDSLRNQAASVLQRMQEAYKQRTFAMHQALAERNEKQEELEETRARVDHLKMQLDGMAAKVLDQEKAMKAMAKELEQERQLRQREEEESRNRSRTMRAIAPDDEIPSLALQTPHRGGKRTSHGTFTSDSGFESGDESVADSVFSQKENLESPTSTLAAPSPSLSHVVLSGAPIPSVQKNLAAGTTHSAPARSSAYERVIKGIASTRLGSSFVGNAGNCNICHGVPASEAWSVMGVLKDENRGLKTRLSELELVIDDCLGLVGP